MKTSKDNVGFMVLFVWLIAIIAFVLFVLILSSSKNFKLKEELYKTELELDSIKKIQK